MEQFFDSTRVLFIVLTVNYSLLDFNRQSTFGIIHDLHILMLVHFDERMWSLIAHDLFYAFSIYAQYWRLIAPVPRYCGSGNKRLSFLRPIFSLLILLITIFVILEGQVVKTDTNNILIRALQLSKHKSEAKDMSSKMPGESSRGKRNAARNLDGKNPSKRPNIGSPTGSSAHEESSSGFSELTLQSFTVEKLRSLLKERGLSPKGKKDELIARLRDASGWFEPQCCWSHANRILLGVTEEHSEYLAVCNANCHVSNFGDVNEF